MSWHDGTIVGFDLETTGVDVFNDRIVTATTIEVPHRGRPTSRDWIVNPGIEISAGASAVHGITTERARAEGMDPSLAVAQIAASVTDALRAGLSVVAFNASYDFSMLEAELARYSLPSLEDHMDGRPLQLVIDPFVIDRELDKYRKGKRTLTATCQVHQVVVAGAHNASADALAAVRLARVLARKHEQLAQYPPGRLMQLQRTWHRDRQLDFKKYLEAQGKDASDVSTDWPVRHPSLLEQGAKA